MNFGFLTYPRFSLAWFFPRTEIADLRRIHFVLFLRPFAVYLNYSVQVWA